MNKKVRGLQGKAMHSASVQGHMGQMVAKPTVKPKPGMSKYKTKAY